jgi:hypothetical protein
MGDDILYSPREIAALLSKYNISIIRKEDESLLLVQFKSEKSYIPLGEKTKSYIEIFKSMCEVAIQIHFTLKDKEDDA